MPGTRPLSTGAALALMTASWHLSAMMALQSGGLALEECGGEQQRYHG